MKSDLKNLLDNVNVATIFLDEQLRIRRFTRDALKLFRLMSSDVGRPLEHIKSSLKAENLLENAQKVLDTLVVFESEFQTEDGDHYLTRILPYRTVHNMIDGVVITFTDISQRVAAELAFQQARRAADGIVETVREPLLVLDGKLNVILASRSFYRAFSVVREATIGQCIFDLGNRQWDIPKLHKLLENILPENESFDDYVVEHDFPGIGLQRVVLNARCISDERGDPQLILLAMTFEDQHLVS